MTNEELIEELYHKAHVKGFFHELHDKVNELNTKNKFIRMALPDGLIEIFTQN